MNHEPIGNVVMHFMEERRLQFYDSIEDSKTKAIERGEPISPSPPILVKPFRRSARGLKLADSLGLRRVSQRAELTRDGRLRSR